MAEVYLLREGVWDLEDDFWIDTQAGRRAFKVNGALRGTVGQLSLADAEDKEVARIQGKLSAVGDKVRIDRVDGSGALLQKDLIMIAREQFILSFDNGDELEIFGDFIGHEYQFDRGQDIVATVSKRRFSVAGSFEVRVQPGEDDLMLVAAAVVLDQTAHDDSPGTP